MITLFVLTSLVSTAAPAASPAAAEPGGISGSQAVKFAELALACVGREYPNKLAHVLNGDSDIKAPHALTPAFFGCYDWHSSVHGHWLLARLLRLSPTAPWAPRARAALAGSLTDPKIEQEVRYLEGDGRASFERPYGLAWLLTLAAELREWSRDGSNPLAKDAAAWSTALQPLEAAAVKHLSTWLPKLTFPVRSGEHSQTAFALGLALDYTRAAPPNPESKAFADLIRARALAFFEHDVVCPLTYEPSGEDFLSPCLAEADLMRRVLPPAKFGPWLEHFLPVEALMFVQPAVVSDAADPKLVHLDGLNLSRAFMLEGIASGLPASNKLAQAVKAAAAAHREAGLKAVSGGHYETGHWLGSFATYLVTERGLAPK